METFFSHLPKSVIRKGRVIDIHGELTETLQVSIKINCICYYFRLFWFRVCTKLIIIIIIIDIIFRAQAIK